MLHAGLDLSRKKIDICLVSGSGEHLEEVVAPPDAEALRRLAGRIDEVYREPVCAVVESMTGARLVHDTLEQEGWDVEIADAQKVKGLAPLACKTDKIDSRVLAVLSQRELVPAIWLPDPRVREERELGPRAAGPTPGPGTLARQHHGERGADRRPRSPDRGDQPQAPRGPRRAPLDPAAAERTGNRLGAGLHDRRRDRPDRKVRLPREARQLGVKLR
jgi:hypothetical protein